MKNRLGHLKTSFFGVEVFRLFPEANHEKNEIREFVKKYEKQYQVLVSISQKFKYQSIDLMEVPLRR